MKDLRHAAKMRFSSAKKLEPSDAELIRFTRVARSNYFKRQKSESLRNQAQFRISAFYLFPFHFRLLAFSATW
jgi:hypothetical protein